MPAPKKAAKHTPGHPGDKHAQAKELRRAYEHMGRVAVLRRSAKLPMLDSVAKLTTLAQQALKEGHTKNAADLLRASEHLTFALLSGDITDVASISAELRQSITEHYDELTRKAEEHWKGESPGVLAMIYRHTRDSAATAFKDGAYHQALEYVRAAEALAHVKEHGPLRLEQGQNHLQLKRA